MKNIIITENQLRLLINNSFDLIKEENMKVWIFGHTHTPYKKTINGTILMSNPYVNGYVKGLGINVEY
jgi:predicted phosphodiesterase